MDVVQLARSEDADLGIGKLAHPLDPVVVLPAVGQVDLAGLIGQVAAGVGQDVAVGDFLDLRRSPEIGLVRLQLDELLRLVFDELERSGPGRLAGEAVAGLLGRRLADDVAAMVGHQQSQQSWHRLRQRDLVGLRIDRFDRLEGRIFGEEAGLVLGCRALQRIDDVVGGQLAAAVALDVFAQGEGPGQLIVGTGPARRQIRLDRLGVGLARRDADETVEDHRHDADIGRRRGAMGIEGAEVVAGGGDAEMIGALGMGACAAEEACEQRRTESEMEVLHG